MRKNRIIGMALTLMFFSIALVALVYSETQVGVKTGDWIKYDYTFPGTPPTPRPLWIKAEFLNVTGTTATVRVTMHMSDGTEQNATMIVDITTGSGATSLQGIVIPANSTIGDQIYITGYGNLTIIGESTRTYLGANRNVVYGNYSQLGNEITYYWDKQTGVMVEISSASGGIIVKAAAVATNMWEGQIFGLDPIVFYALIIALVVIIVAVLVFAVRRKKKTPEATLPQSKDENT